MAVDLRWVCCLVSTQSRSMRVVTLAALTFWGKMEGIHLRMRRCRTELPSIYIEHAASAHVEFSSTYSAETESLSS